MSNLQFPTAFEQKVGNIYSDDQGLVVEGNYYVATTPTPGTGVAGSVATTETQTTPILLMENAASLASGTNILLRYIKFRVTAAPASATGWEMSIRWGSNVNAYTSGGSALVANNANTGASRRSSAAIYVGAITAVTLAGGSILGRHTLDTAIPVVGDQYILNFGGGLAATGASLLNGGTTAKTMSVPCAPVVLGPQHWLGIYMWGASNAVTPISVEVEMGYSER